MIADHHPLSLRIRGVDGSPEDARARERHRDHTFVAADDDARHWPRLRDERDVDSRGPRAAVEHPQRVHAQRVTVAIHVVEHRVAVVIEAYGLELIPDVGLHGQQVGRRAAERSEA